MSRSPNPQKLAAQLEALAPKLAAALRSAPTSPTAAALARTASRQDQEIRDLRAQLAKTQEALRSAQAEREAFRQEIPALMRELDALRKPGPPAPREGGAS